MVPDRTLHIEHHRTWSAYNVWTAFVAEQSKRKTIILGIDTTTSSWQPPPRLSNGTRKVNIGHSKFQNKLALAARALRVPSCLAFARAVRRVLYASNSRSSEVILRGASVEWGSGRGKEMRVVVAERSSAWKSLFSMSTRHQRNTQYSLKNRPFWACQSYGGRRSTFACRQAVFQR